MIDIVFPQDNENELISTAEKLGYDKLIFVYSDVKKVLKIENHYTALIVEPKKVKQYKGRVDFIVVRADEETSRFAIEKMKPDIMFGFEDSEKSDTMHQRYSGLNHVSCSFAFENKVRIAFSFKSLLDSYGYKRARLFGRMMQNIKLCRKYKIKTLIASFADKPSQMRSPADLQSIFIAIGMHPKEAKESQQIQKH